MIKGSEQNQKDEEYLILMKSMFCAVRVGNERFGWFVDRNIQFHCILHTTHFSL